MTGTQLRSNIREEYARAYDSGHEFSTQKTVDEQTTYQVILRVKPSTVEKVYTGPMLINIALVNQSHTYPSYQSHLPSSNQKKLDGTKLWSMAVPTASEVSLAAFLGELREGLPSLPGSSVGKAPGPHASAEEYLNWKFGVVPLKQDLQNLARGIAEFHKRVQQFRRDSGRNVRRHRKLAETRTGSVVQTPVSATGYIGIQRKNLVDVFASDYYQSAGKIDVFDIVETKISFAGAYTYYLSEAHDFLGKLERYEQLANHALGVEFDLDTAWELTPWSWLVGWFSDSSSFVKNLVAISNDNVVARYAYVMHHIKVTRMYSVTGMLLKSGASGPTSSHAFETFESKTRTAATPYGFGFNLGTLSSTQKAILGALGITRAPGVLHSAS